MDIKLFVIEPNSLRRRRLSEAASRAGLEIAGSVGSLEEAFNVPNGVDMFLVATEAAAEEPGYLPALSGEHPDVKFILFGAQPDLDLLLTSAPAGVRGYLAYNHLSDEEFVHSLDIIAHGGAVIEPLTAGLLLDHLAGRSIRAAPHQAAANSDLTVREEEVVEHVRRGLSNKEIAREMGISLGTVRAHLRSIFRKLEVSSRAGAAAKSMAHSRSDLSHTA